LAEYVNVEECITCASGTDALLIPLIAQNISSGDAVFTTNFSFFATSEVISHIGATPVFVDVDKNTFNISPELLENQIKKVIKEGKLKPKAIIAVDLFGQLADYNAIKKIAEKFNLFLIEDAAQSFGASFKNIKSCSFGDVAATSFYPAKPLGCYGDGGAIFTNNKELANIYRSVRVHGQGKDKYDNVRIGLNSRLDTIQASVLLNKLDIFDDEIKLRNDIADYYF
jgi:dTDP-4-amino-4,6-dideoxygalactose transaminase